MREGRGGGGGREGEGERGGEGGEDGVSKLLTTTIVFVIVLQSFVTLPVPMVPVSPATTAPAPQGSAGGAVRPP